MKKEWFEDEGFWAEYAPVMFDDRRWAEVPDVVDAILSWCGPSPRLRVLDLCCGPGRHTLEFARRGHGVTGVDIMKSYLGAARESAELEGLSPELVLSDVRAFSRPASFDLALNLYTSFGYFESQADDLRLASVACESLAPGGRFVMELVGKEILARDNIEEEWYEEDGFTVLTEYKVLEGWSKMRNRWVLYDAKGARHDFTFIQRLYSGKELKDLFLAAGFSRVSLFGDYAGHPYDNKATSLIAVGEKD